MGFSPEDKKKKNMDTLSRLIQEMNKMDASEEDKEDSPLSKMVEGSPEEEASESPEEEASEDPGHESLSHEEIAELLKSKNSAPKKKGMISMSIMKVSPGKSGKKPFGRK